MHVHARFETALQMLDGRLSLVSAPCYRVVVCGGTALVAMGFLERATKDVDIVALADESGALVDPSPGYRLGLCAFLEEFGRGHLCERI